jgi:CBS domain-containing protein
MLSAPTLQAHNMTITIAEILKDKAQQSPGTALFSLPPTAPISDAVAMMVNNKISSVIVMERGAMVGLITLRELLAGLSAQGGALLAATCASVMKTNPPVAKPTDSVDHLRGLMTELYLSHVPVMENSKLVGILSFFDIARSAIKDVDFENKLLKQYIRNWPE